MLLCCPGAMMLFKDLKRVARCFKGEKRVVCGLMVYLRVITVSKHIWLDGGYIQCTYIQRKLTNLLIITEQIPEYLSTNCAISPPNFFTLKALSYMFQVLPLDYYIDRYIWVILYFRWEEWEERYNILCCDQSRLWFTAQTWRCCVSNKPIQS